VQREQHGVASAARSGPCARARPHSAAWQNPESREGGGIRGAGGLQQRLGLFLELLEIRALG
jgi:hypothetical protein